MMMEIYMNMLFRRRIKKSSRMPFHILICYDIWRTGDFHYLRNISNNEKKVWHKRVRLITWHGGSSFSSSFSSTTSSAPFTAKKIICNSGHPPRIAFYVRILHPLYFEAIPVRLTLNTCRGSWRWCFNGGLFLVDASIKWICEGATKIAVHIGVDSKWT